MSPDLRHIVDAAITLTPEQARDVDREALLLSCVDMLERYDALIDRLVRINERQTEHVLTLVDKCIGEHDTYADMHAVAAVNALSDFRDRFTGGDE